jgi:putative ABC transport system permease protein
LSQLFTLALRAILTGRFYSLVSILGLSIAISATLLVALLIRHEIQYDRQFTKADSIYRLTWENIGTGDRFATMFNPFSPQMKLEFDEVLEVARLGIYELTLQSTRSSASQASYESLAMVDPAFFRLFDFDFLAGSADSLNQPNSIVMTRAAAEKYFPGKNPLGQTLLLENQVTLTVTGLLADIPATSHFTAHFFIPLETLRSVFDGASFLENWGSDRFYHYIELAEAASPSEIEEQLPAFLERHDHEWPQGSVDIGLQKLRDIHFTTDLQSDMPVHDQLNNIIKAPRQTSDLVLFATGAFFLILVASFNFMNLLVARSVGRGRQVAMLKVVGANKRGVIAYILMESLLMCVFSLLVAVLLVEVSLSSFSQILAVSLSWSDLLKPVLGGMALLLVVVLGLLSGVYPAILMASQKPSSIMRGELRLGRNAARIRSALVLMQFAVSVTLIVVSLVIYAQIQFSLRAPLGFDSDNVVVIQLDRRARDQYAALRSRLLDQPGVLQISRGSIIPTDHLSDGSALKPEGSEDELAMRMVLVDYDYFETLGIDIMAGRSYLREFEADEFAFPTPENRHVEGAIIINEAAARRAGWTAQDGVDSAIGKFLSTEHTIDGVTMTMRFRVVGIAKDVHFRSLRSEIVPMEYYLARTGRRLVVRFSDGVAPKEASALLQESWDQVLPGVPLRLGWLQESVNQLYTQEHRALNLISIIALLAIAVACLGLFAVATLMTGLRTREIGIRKILGAGIREIVRLLSWQFIKPVLLANLLAWPVAWLYLSDWLQSFAYRVELGWAYFVLPGLVAISIAWITVAGQAWKVAKANPIHALRCDQ